MQFQNVSAMSVKIEQTHVRFSPGVVQRPSAKALARLRLISLIAGGDVTHLTVWGVLHGVGCTCGLRNRSHGSAKQES